MAPNRRYYHSQNPSHYPHYHHILKVVVAYHRRLDPQLMLKLGLRNRILADAELGDWPCVQVGHDQLAKVNLRRMSQEQFQYESSLSSH